VGRGPGSYTRSGFITGISLAWGGEKSIYIPLRHPDTENFDHQQVGAWLRELFSNPSTSWILHNAGYDISWIRAEWGILPPAHIEDTGALAALVDENRTSYKLDDLAKWRGIQGKDEAILNEAAITYGFKDNVKENLWKLPAKFVGPYAEQDAVATLKLAHSLREEIEKQDLGDAAKIEMGLIPLIHEMSWRGVRVDTDRATQALKKFTDLRNKEIKELSNLLGFSVGMEEINSARQIEKWFDNLKIPYMRTEKSKQGKFDSEFLEKNPHWLPQKIYRIRQLESGSSKFLQGFILDFAHRGRLHSSINQFRNEGGGTRSHRLSYNSPPLQQMPSRDKSELKQDFVTEIRGCFIPEEGEVWGSHDLSQQEFRIMVHYAELMQLRKADMAGNKYREDPNTDFHDVVASLTGLYRKRAKDVNFAKAFGAGVAKFALMANLTESEARDIMAQYDEQMPFIKEASERCKGVAERKGFIRLLDGARCHFDQWEAAYRNWEQEQSYTGGLGTFPTSLEEAKRRIEDPTHPWKNRLVRAFTHKAFNRLIQGGAARQVKKAMLDCWKNGLVPLLQIHDELCFSHSEEKQGGTVNRIMRDAIKLTVPMRCDSEYGTSWGTARLVEDKDKKILYDATWSSALRLKNEGRWW
jgi:DNA polymerase I-like protein with 3'-5' exonuclease and polymerase domains